MGQQTVGKVKLNDLALSINMGDEWFIMVTSSECSNTERRSCSRLLRGAFTERERRSRKLMKKSCDVRESSAEKNLHVI